jgi:hypothetical protein
MATEEHHEVLTSAAAKLFDIRIMIGGLFTVYGVLLIIYGFFTSEEDIAQAAGIHINLWLGAGMLLLGIYFLVWARIQPTKPPSADAAARSASRPGQH